MSERGLALSAQLGWLRGEEMKAPDEVAAMLRLNALGWGVKRIARELGCSHMTVRRYPGFAVGRHIWRGGRSAST